MKRVTCILAFFVFVGLQLTQAQTVQITGTVTSAEDGSIVPGATVMAKGTTVGTVADFEGKYSLGVPAGATTLVVSFVGMRTQEVAIAGRSVVNVSLQPDVVGLDEVVVTALGITREKRSLGYSVQDVKGDDLRQVGQTNVVNSLSGKVAGVQVTGTPGGLGGSSRILIRGVNSITGNNQPLFVVDGIPMDNADYNSANAARGGGGFDYGNMAMDINPEDIESMSVLKGPSAAALYGSRAANGVIVITTKKSRAGEKKPVGITLNYGVAFEQIAVLPKYQNLYGGGSIYTEADGENGFQKVNINGTDYLVPDFGFDESWGPKYDPNINVLAWNSFDPWDSKNYLVPKPWVLPKNDVKDFFETGITHNTNIALTGGSDVSSFRLSYTNLTQSGIMPNSNLTKNGINFNGESKFGNRLTAFSSVNYMRTVALGRSETGYGDNNPMVRFNQWGQRQLDMVDQKDYRNPDGTQRTWNRSGWDDPTPVYSNNPYWSRYMDYQDDDRDRYYGNMGMSYKITDWLNAQGKVMTDRYTFNSRERIAIGSAFQPRYEENTRQFSEMNYEFLFLVSHQLSSDLSLNATLGGNRMDRYYQRSTGYTQDGMVISEHYTLSNSITPAFVESVKNKKRINSLLGSLSLGYMNMFFLDLTARNDWSSTLPSGSNSYLYPSANMSFVFTELEPLKNNAILSFGKLRGGWAKVGNDTDPYSLVDVFIAEQNFGTNPNYRLSTRLNNPDLRPEMTTSVEFGGELRFLNNRLGLDVTYFNNKSIDQIIPVATSSATGYRTQVINAGEMRNNGVEFVLNATPVKLASGFSWDVLVNFAKINNEVVELADDVNTYRLGNIFGIEVHAEKGLPYGSIRGNTYVKDNDGNLIVGTNGRLLNGPVASVGSVLPDWNAGIWNSFKYKGFDFAFLVDWQKGGRLFSMTHMWGTYSGILEETAETNSNGKNVRDAVADGGGKLIEAVYGRRNADGSVTYLNKDGSESAVPVQNDTYINVMTWAADHYSRGRADQNTIDTDYVKLREARLGYTLPSRFTGPLQNVNVSVFGRNLWIVHRKSNHIDPENVHSSGNVQGIEGGQFPSTRVFGVNVSVGF